jgi:RAQPRD family integrative conjugative element protein
MKKKRTIKRKMMVGCLFMSVLLNSSVYADTEKERVYLTEIDHQLDALQPLLQAAERAQNKTARVRLHYTAYRDRQGKSHAGLREELAHIQKSIGDQLTTLSYEPAPIQPIQGDVAAFHHGGRVW